MSILDKFEAVVVGIMCVYIFIVSIPLLVGAVGMIFNQAWINGDITMVLLSLGYIPFSALALGSAIKIAVATA